MSRMQTMPSTSSARSRLVVPAVVLIAVAAGCFFAVDEDHVGRRSAPAPVAQQTARTSTGEEITRTEFNARVNAQQPLAQQPPQQQRRYYETWVGALQRSQATQQMILDQLRVQRDALAPDDPKRAAIDDSIAAADKQMTGRADQLATFTAKAKALREP
jgi:hypothetical protein